MLNLMDTTELSISTRVFWMRLVGIVHVSSDLETSQTEHCTDSSEILQPMVIDSI